MNVNKNQYIISRNSQIKKTKDEIKGLETALKVITDKSAMNVIKNMIANKKLKIERLIRELEEKTI